MTSERSRSVYPLGVGTCPSCQQSYEDASFCPRDGHRLVGEIVLGSVVGERYRLVKKVGEGAMGEVYEAEHAHMRRKVAVKVLHRKFATDADAIARLRREAESTGKLVHPNIVDSLDFGRSADGHVYLVMEWLDGETLEKRIERGPLEIAEAIEIAVQASAGLAAAHEQGIVHRDVKPANLFLTRTGDGRLLVKLLDFGIAKLVLEQSSLTGTGAVIGTPNYMAPEQALGDQLDGRADQYSLGVILYEMVAGRPPFQADSPLVVLHQHASSKPVPLGARARTRRVPAALEAIVMRCLEKQPAARFPTINHLRAALAAMNDSDTAAATSPALDVDDAQDLAAPRSRIRWIVASLVLVALGLGGALAWHLAEDQVRAPVVDRDAHDERPSTVVEARGAHGSVVVIVTPNAPAPEQPFELSILIRDLDPVLRDPLASGKLTARMTLTRSGDRTSAHESTHRLEREGRFSVGVDLPTSGPHDAQIIFMVAGREVDRVRFVLFGQVR